jgi:hypothetical protein
MYGWLHGHVFPISAMHNSGYSNSKQKVYYKVFQNAIVFAILGLCPYSTLAGAAKRGLETASWTDITTPKPSWTLYSSTPRHAGKKPSFHRTQLATYKLPFNALLDRSLNTCAKLDRPQKPCYHYAASSSGSMSAHHATFNLASLSVTARGPTPRLYGTCRDLISHVNGAHDVYSSYHLWGAVADRYSATAIVIHETILLNI